VALVVCLTFRLIALARFCAVGTWYSMARSEKPAAVLPSGDIHHLPVRLRICVDR
jgi:hypothetical protein